MTREQAVYNAAVRAGMRADPELVHLMPLDQLKVDGEGRVKIPDDFIPKFRALKPHLFGKPVAELTDAEMAQHLYEMESKRCRR